MFVGERERERERECGPAFVSLHSHAPRWSDLDVSGKVEPGDEQPEDDHLRAAAPRPTSSDRQPSSEGVLPAFEWGRGPALGAGAVGA